MNKAVYDLDGAVLLLPDAVLGRLLVAAERINLHVGKEVDDAVRGDGGLARLVQGGPRVPTVMGDIEIRRSRKSWPSLVDKNSV